MLTSDDPEQVSLTLMPNLFLPHGGGNADETEQRHDTCLLHMRARSRVLPPRSGRGQNVHPNNTLHCSREDFPSNVKSLLDHRSPFLIQTLAHLRPVSCDHIGQSLCELQVGQCLLEELLNHFFVERLLCKCEERRCGLRGQDGEDQQCAEERDQ